MKSKWLIPMLSIPVATCAPGIDDPDYYTGELGDPCSATVDCKEGLECVARRCTEEGNFPRQWGTQKLDQALAAAVDDRGSIYVSGLTAGALGKNINQGLEDAFLTKLSQKGEILWHEQFGSEKKDEAKSIAVGTSQNIYVTGSLGREGSNSDVVLFLAKYTPEGERLWLETWEAEKGGYAHSVVLDTEENAYVTGCLGCPIWVQFYLFPETYGDVEAYVAKVSPEGETLWTLTWDEHDKEAVTGLALDAEQNILAVGHYGYVVSSDAGDRYYWNSRLIKLSPDGEEIFNRPWEGSKSHRTNQFVRIATDPMGNIYGGGLIDAQIDGMNATGDMLLVKWSPEGDEQWSLDFGGPVYDEIDSVAVQGDSRILVSGCFGNGSADLLTGEGFDIGLFEFTPEGNQVAKKEWGTPKNELLALLALGPEGHVYLASATNGEMVEGAHQGDSDAFLLRVE